MSYTAAIGWVFTSFGKYVGVSVFVLLLFFTSLAEAVDARSPVPFIENFGVRIVAADQENYNIAQSMVNGDPPMGFFARLPFLWPFVQLFNVVGNLFFFYWIFIWLSRFIGSFVQMGTAPFVIYGIAFSHLWLFHIIASLYFVGVPSAPVEFLRWIPFSGTAYALLNYKSFFVMVI